MATDNWQELRKPFPESGFNEIRPTVDFSALGIDWFGGFIRRKARSPSKKILTSDKLVSSVTFPKGLSNGTFYPASFGASPGAPISVEVQSMVSDCFPRTAAIGREFPQFALKASASLTEGRGPKYKGRQDLRYLLAANNRERA